MTEHEAWAEIYYALKTMRVMPDYWCSGLCSILHGMLSEGIISEKTYRTMTDRILREFNSFPGRGSYPFLEDPYDAVVRVKWAKKFMEETQ